LFFQFSERERAEELINWEGKHTKGRRSGRGGLRRPRFLAAEASWPVATRVQVTAATARRGRRPLGDQSTAATKNGEMSEGGAWSRSTEEKKWRDEGNLGRERKKKWRMEIDEGNLERKKKKKDQIFH
jgi:hypothetical protein